MATKTQIKLIDGLVSRINELIDEGLELSFEERPFLENPGITPVITEQPARRAKIEAKLKKTQAALTKVLAEAFPPVPPKQEELL